MFLGGWPFAALETILLINYAFGQPTCLHVKKAVCLETFAGWPWLLFQLSSLEGNLVLKTSAALQLYPVVGKASVVNLEETGVGAQLYNRRKGFFLTVVGVRQSCLLPITCAAQYLFGEHHAWNPSWSLHFHFHRWKTDLQLVKVMEEASRHRGGQRKTGLQSWVDWLSCAIPAHYRQIQVYVTSLAICPVYLHALPIP